MQMGARMGRTGYTDGKHGVRRRSVWRVQTMCIGLAPTEAYTQCR